MRAGHREEGNLDKRCWDESTSYLDYKYVEDI